MASKPNTALSKQPVTGTSIYVPVNSIALYAENLPQMKQDFIVAIKSPRISQLEQFDVHSEIDTLIEKLYFEIGDKITDNIDKKALIKAFKDKIYRWYPYVSIPDIANAFAMGAHGEFDQQLFVRHDSNNITVVLLESWIKAYLSHSDRLSTIEKQRQFENKLLAEKELEERAKANKLLTRNIVDLFCQKYTEALKSNKFVGYANFEIFWYQFLTDNKIMNITNEEKAEFWKRAKALVTEHYQHAMDRSIGDSRLTSKKQRAIKSMSDDYKTLITYFNSCKDVSEKELLELIVRDIRFESRILSVHKFIGDCLEKKFDLVKEVRKIQI